MSCASVAPLSIAPLLTLRRESSGRVEEAIGAAGLVVGEVRSLEEGLLVLCAWSLKWHAVPYETKAVLCQLLDPELRFLGVHPARVRSEQPRQLC